MSASTCVRVRQFIGYCGKTAVTEGPALCRAHAGDECHCGESATTECAQTAIGSICGRPLCVTHKDACTCVAGGRRAERPDGGDRAESRDDAGSSQPFSPLWVRTTASSISVRDDLVNEASGRTFAEAEKALHAARFDYESDPARKG